MGHALQPKFQHFLHLIAQRTRNLPSDNILYPQLSVSVCSGTCIRSSVQCGAHGDTIGAVGQQVGSLEVSSMWHPTWHPPSAIMGGTAVQCSNCTCTKPEMNFRLPRVTKGTSFPEPLREMPRAHQTSPIVKLGDPEHFTNSHPYEAILGAIDASWGVLSRKKFRRWLKKFFG